MKQLECLKREVRRELFSVPSVRHKSPKASEPRDWSSRLFLFSLQLLGGDTDVTTETGILTSILLNTTMEALGLRK